ncbi:hypothetical protein EG329_009973 [Mollisiaceae sp. DMI_Dod_QoI]|nr:hypothetical protein EG329_009973 [Helotiales sp. DMI_Dod_QoI]
MSVTGISTTGGGGGTSTFTTCSAATCSLATSTSSEQASFTATVTLPVPPPGSTTLTSLITLSPTSITTSTTTTTSSNFISTTTATTLSVTPLPNPAATAALAAESSLLNQNANLTRTNLTVTIVLGSVSFFLLILLLILLFICFRRRATKAADTESPPFTSLAPRPAPNFPGVSPPPQIPLPTHMRETSLSMGPRGGPAETLSRLGQYPSSPSPQSSQPQYPSPQSQPGYLSQSQRGGPFAFQFPYPGGASSSGARQTPEQITKEGEGAQQGQALALASNPVSPPTRTRLLRSSSAPTSAPTPAPTIPRLPFLDSPNRGLGPIALDPSSTQTQTQTQGPPRIALFPATPAESSLVSPSGSTSGFGAPLTRQRSVPMYHRALQEQVVAEREEEAGREAVRLGVSVIGMAEQGRRESEMSSEISFGSEEEDEDEDEDEDDGKGVEEGEGKGVERERERRRSEGGGNGNGGNGGNGGLGTGEGERGRVLHSTRASSGVFPEGPGMGSEAAAGGAGGGTGTGVEEKDVYS